MGNLSPREHEVARLTILGNTMKETASKLFRSPLTIQNHLRNIYAKTGTHNAQELCVYYLKQYHDIDLRKLLTMVVFLLLLSPEVIGRNNQDVVRVFRTVKANRGGRSGRRKDTYYYGED